MGDSASHQAADATSDGIDDSLAPGSFALLFCLFRYVFFDGAIVLLVYLMWFLFSVACLLVLTVLTLLCCVFAVGLLQHDCLTCMSDVLFVFCCIFAGPMGDLAIHRAAAAGSFYSVFCDSTTFFSRQSDCYTCIFDIVSVSSLCLLAFLGMAMGNSASPRAAVAALGSFTQCPTEVDIGGGGLCFFGGSIFETVVDVACLMRF